MYVRVGIMKADVCMYIYVVCIFLLYVLLDHKTSLTYVHTRDN